jgi:serine/threonine-protein kinase
VEPAQAPPYRVDAQAAWKGDGDSVRVEAALRRGKAVWLRVVRPWTPPAGGEADGRERVQLFFWLLTILFTGITVVAAVLARRNLKSGRGDRRGAWRLAGFIAAGGFAASLLRGSHDVSLRTVGIQQENLAQALLMGAVVFLLYLAIEPEVRRRWPRRIVGWTRLLDGKFRDPLVGRDLLVGAAGGAAFLSAGALSLLLGRLVAGAPPGYLVPPYEAALLGAPGVVANAAWAMTAGIVVAFAFFVFFLAAARVLRREWLGGAAYLLVMSGGLAIVSTGPWEIIGNSIQIALTLLLMVRFGLLAWTAACVGAHLFFTYPATGDLSAWYAGEFLAVIGCLLAMAVYGAWVATRPPRRAVPAPD